MKVMVGISHPKQVYMFKNLFFKLKEEGEEVLVVVVDKEISTVLLSELGIEFIKIGENKSKLLYKMISIIPATWKTFVLSLKFRPDIFVGQALPYLAFTSFLLRKPFIIFEDTENAIIPHLVANPFSSSIITPSFFKKDFGKKQITINGSFELAYLRENWFKPNEGVLKVLGLSLGEKYTIVRFVGWTANHDIGHSGISSVNKIKAVKEFLNYGKVFISSESELPSELDKYRINIHPSDMHSIMYYSSLVYGESASMAAEASYLGTPSIFIDNVGRGYTDELSKFDLLYHFTESIKDQEESIWKANEILSTKDKLRWVKNAKILISDKIDVGSFMNWFIINYPDSKKVMNDNPSFQELFKH